MMVAPGSAASAADVAVLRSVPVSRVSFGPCVSVLGSCAPDGAPVGGWVGAAEDEEEELELAGVDVEVAAEATPAAPRLSPATAAVESSSRRARLGVDGIGCPFSRDAAGLSCSTAIVTGRSKSSPRQGLRRPEDCVRVPKWSGG